jgi:hypothetical protein
MHTLHTLTTIFIATTVSALDDAVGSFEIIGRSGVPAMHAALLPEGDVVFLDKIETWTELTLDNGRPAYSSIYNPVTQALTPVAVSTNPFCCGGTFLVDGRLATFGGNGNLSWLDPTIEDGFDAIRYLHLGKDPVWQEPGNKLSSKRWYATAQTLADGSIFVAAGSLNGMNLHDQSNNNPTYEILDRRALSTGASIPMDILVRNQPY